MKIFISKYHKLSKKNIEEIIVNVDVILDTLNNQNIKLRIGQLQFLFLRSVSKKNKIPVEFYAKLFLLYANSIM